MTVIGVSQSVCEDDWVSILLEIVQVCIESSSHSHYCVSDSDAYVTVFYAVPLVSILCDARLNGNLHTVTFIKEPTNRSHPTVPLVSTLCDTRLTHTRVVIQRMHSHSQMTQSSPHSAHRVMPMQRLLCQWQWCMCHSHPLTVPGVRIVCDTRLTDTQVAVTQLCGDDCDTRGRLLLDRWCVMSTELVRENMFIQHYINFLIYHYYIHDVSWV